MHSNVAVFSSVEKANQICKFFSTVQDKYAPCYLRKVWSHNSTPWIESIRDELLNAKKNRRQAERRWKNTKLFSKTWKCTYTTNFKTCAWSNRQFSSEVIAPTTSFEDLRLIINTLSDWHQPVKLQTIYPSANLLSLIFKHNNNEVRKHRSNIASKSVTLSSTKVSRTASATFSSFENV